VTWGIDMQEFSLNTSKISAHFEFYDKYILVDGYSGRGKSLFVSEVDRALELDSESLKATMECMTVNSKKELELAIRLMNEGQDFILVSDEFLGYKVIQAIQNRNSYCIVVTRKRYSNINMSYRVLYHVSRDSNGFTSIVKTDELVEHNGLTKFDKILVEDEKAGYEYISAVVGNKALVESTHGKDNIKECIRGSKGLKSLLVVCDGGGIAYNWSAIKRAVLFMESLGCEVRICIPECFEHVLLCSEFIGYPKDLSDTFQVRYNNTEAFCEQMVEKESSGKPFEYNHKSQKLSDCWLIDCSECKNFKNCEYRVSGNKIKSVLINGPFSPFLWME
jgi:hypothetical protein